MAEINLEAEQVVEEEDERAPGEKRSLLKGRRNMIIFGVVVLAEAVALFFLFDVLRGPSDTPAANAGAKDEPQAVSHQWEVPEDGRLDLGEVSVTEDNFSNPKADRRASVFVVIVLEKEMHSELMAAAEENPDTLLLVKDALVEEVRLYLLGKGIQKLKAFEVQLRLQDEIREHLLDRLPYLRGRLRKVFIKDVNFSRY